MAFSDETKASSVHDKEKCTSADVDGSERGTSTAAGPNRHLKVLLAASGVVVLGSIGLFATISNSQQPSAQPQQPLQSDQAMTEAQEQVIPAQSTSQEFVDNIKDAIKRLEARLADNPDDADGWRVLGWSYYNLERYADAATAYRRSSELKEDTAILKSLHGEALVKSAGGRVTTEAKKVFEAALVLDPNDVRARYFTGLASAQTGNAQGAVDTWIALLKIAPGKAEWAHELRRRIVTFAADEGIDIADSLPETKDSAEIELVQATQAPKEPTAEDIKNAEEMSQEDRMAMVRGMVESLAERLKASPENPDGWVRLIRSWLVLEEKELARTALSDAMKAFADRPRIQARIKSSAKSLGMTVN